MDDASIEKHGATRRGGTCVYFGDGHLLLLVGVGSGSRMRSRRHRWVGYFQLDFGLISCVDAYILLFIRRNDRVRDTDAHSDICTVGAALGQVDVHCSFKSVSNERDAQPGLLHVI